MKYKAREKKFFIGMVDNEKIFLSTPEWHCDWYWSFGYLGNDDCHYHLDGLAKGKNLYDGMKEHFDTLYIPDENLWQFCELAMTAYSLKEAAEILGRGGSHYTKNPCQEIIQDKDYTKHINETVLPAVFTKIEDMLTLINKQRYGQRTR